jgi:hypothetical protein
MLSFLINQSINALHIGHSVISLTILFFAFYITCENARRISNQSMHLHHISTIVRSTRGKSPGPIIMINQSETLRSSQIIFITLFFLHVHSSDAPFTIHCKQTVRLCWAKTSFFMSRTGMFFDFCSSNFYSLGPHTEHRWRCCVTCSTYWTSPPKRVMVLSRIYICYVPIWKGPKWKAFHYWRATT